MKRAELQRRLEQKRARKRRIWLGFLLLLLLLLLLLSRCSCTQEPPVLPGEEAVGPALIEEALEPEEPLPRVAPVERVDRPEYRSELPEPLPWLDAFRMQVAARSPRLGQCFIGAERPGRLRWTASVEPLEGSVSEHQLEPMLQGDALTQKQRTCAIGVLSDPPYTLEGPGRSTPSLLSMVIEF